MISNSSIQNQNVINSNNISGSSSGSVVCSSLTLTDGTNTTILEPTNTTTNNITVNGTATFNQLALMNLGGRVYSNSFILFNTDFRVMDATGTLGFQIFSSNDSNNFTTIQGIGANSKFQIRTRDATTQQTNFIIQNGNQVTIQGTAGQGISIFNDQTT